MEVNRGGKGMILSRAFEFPPWTCSARCLIPWLICSTREKFPLSVYVWGTGTGHVDYAKRTPKPNGAARATCVLPRVRNPPILHLRFFFFDEDERRRTRQLGCRPMGRWCLHDSH